MSSSTPPLPSTLDVALPLVLLGVLVVLGLVWTVLDREPPRNGD